MKLYASLASSFARKIRVMLIEKKVAHEVEMINLWEANDLKTRRNAARPGSTGNAAKPTPASPRSKTCWATAPGARAMR